MGSLLDWIYGKDRPPVVTAADMSAKMQKLAEEANRKVAELAEAERRKARPGSPK